jgi:hypothetical protein
MDNVPVDAVPKTSRAAASRRRVVRVLAWSLWGGGLVALIAGGGKRSSAQTETPTSTPTPTVTPRCRGEGKPCEGNRECCAGLVCRVTGPGAGRRCSRP